MTGAVGRACLPIHRGRKSFRKPQRRTLQFHRNLNLSSRLEQTRTRKITNLCVIHLYTTSIFHHRAVISTRHMRDCIDSDSD